MGVLLISIRKSYESWLLFDQFSNGLMSYTHEAMTFSVII